MDRPTIEHDDAFGPRVEEAPAADAATALIPRATIEDIVEARDTALKLYDEAWLLGSAFQDGIKDAQAMAAKAHPRRERGNRYSHHQLDEVDRFYKTLQLPSREEYLRTARKLLDCEVWAWVIEHTRLEHLMDSEAKKKLLEQMRYVPERTERDRQLITGAEVALGLPPVDVATIYATIEHWHRESGTMFVRGVVKVFSDLDRRFRSHGGFKIGNRIILDRAFNESGHWSYSGYGQEIKDKLIDVERSLQDPRWRRRAPWPLYQHHRDDRQEPGRHLPRNLYRGCDRVLQGSDLQERQPASVVRAQGSAGARQQADRRVVRRGDRRRAGGGR